MVALLNLIGREYLQGALSKKETREAFLVYIEFLKKTYQLTIVDCHVHPLDVMGVMHPDDEEHEPAMLMNERKVQSSSLHPTLLDKLEFNRLASVLSKLGASVFPGIMKREIRRTYGSISSSKILWEMELSSVDQSVLLPIEPWISAKVIHARFPDRHFTCLGSIDIWKIHRDDIENEIDRQQKELGIVGIKLHPNLQGFFPQPGDNRPDIADKLRLIYKTAERKNLYLHFHGGTSYYTADCHPKYGAVLWARKNALLERFCDSNGKSEIFGRYHIPVVIAHLGHSGIGSLNISLLTKMIRTYDGIYFDTSGTSPRLMAEFIAAVGADRVIFGSDAMYNRMLYALYFVFRAVSNLAAGEERDLMMAGILGRNYENQFKQRRR